MSVIFKGSGVSGMRQNYPAPVPSSGTPQPIHDTSVSNAPDPIHYTQNTGNRQEDQDPPVPRGCHMYPTDLSSNLGPDQCQQDIVGTPGNPFTSGEGTIFRGAPNTGTE